MRVRERDSRVVSVRERGSRVSVWHVCWGRERDRHGVVVGVWVRRVVQIVEFCIANFLFKFGQLHFLL
jgi:hypothetical protein